MKWFKHFSNSKYDPKIMRLIKKYGLRGYGLYFAVVEYISSHLETNKPLPDLEENSQDIASFFGEDTLLVEEILLFCLNQQLFEQDENTGRIVCLKLLTHLDNTMANNPEIRKIIDNFNKLDKNNIIQLENQENLKFLQVSSSSLKQTRLDETRLDENKKDNTLSGKPDDTQFNSQIAEIIDYLNNKAKTKYKPSTKNSRLHIIARLKEGYTVDDFKKVMNTKSSWLTDKEMHRYYRPETLFGSKFEGYVNEKTAKDYFRDKYM